jgi:N-acetyl-anhydromuramyl-L-alanine amidase AmpD
VNIDWKPVANYWRGRGGERVRAICLHVAEGDRAGVLSWFNNPASDASAHFLVNKDGTVWQFVDTDDTAWANGVVNAPDLTLPWLADCLRRGQNPNRLTIAVETERRWREPLTEPQYAALVALLRELLARYGLPADREHVVPHAAIDSVNRANCPGNVDWPRLLADLTAPAGSQTFPETGQTVRGAFLAFWRERGGLPLFGYPLTGEFAERGLTVQYFERARFELHPDAPAAQRVQLGRVGAELLAAMSAER